MIQIGDIAIKEPVYYTMSNETLLIFLSHLTMTKVHPSTTVSTTSVTDHQDVLSEQGSTDNGRKSIISYMMIFPLYKIFHAVVNVL